MFTPSIIHSRLSTLRHLAKSVRPMSTAATTDKVLHTSHSESLFEFQLNKPKALNAVDQDMIDSIHNQVKVWNNSAWPSTVLISGTGGKAFCAGGDIVSIYKAKVDGIHPETPRNFFAQEYIVDNALAAMPATQVSIWNGIVMGGGVGLSAHSHIRVATNNTMYAMPETGIGFFTDVGGSYFLSRL